MSSIGGSLLAEQTALSFNPTPPSPGSSPVLPCDVCQGRGGETRFAMNQKTQLRFNLGVQPDNSNMVTNFDPTRQSPVIVEKVPSVTVGLSRTPIHDFKAASAKRLAMAMKLARRDVQFKAAPTTEVPTTELDDRKSKGDFRDFSVQCDTTPLKTTSPHHAMPHKATSPCNVVPSSVFEKAVLKRSDMISRRVAQIKTEVKQHLMKIEQFKKGVKQGWWQDQEEVDREREHRRRQERATRNSRMIYDLSQQVKGLQRHFDRQDHRNALPLVVRKITTAQRVALGILQSYGGQNQTSPDPVPPELTLIIHQLALLSSQLGENASLPLTVGLLELMDILEERHQEAIQWRSAARKRGTKFKKKKPIPSTKKKQKNHLHRLGEHSTHYSDQTFTSMMRQHLNMSSQLSPKMLYSTPNQGTPHLSQPLFIPPSSPYPSEEVPVGRKPKSGTKQPPHAHMATRKAKINKTHQKGKVRVVVDGEEGSSVVHSPISSPNTALPKSPISPTPNAEAPISPTPKAEAPADSLTSAIMLQANQLQELTEHVTQKMDELSASIKTAKSVNSPRTFRVKQLLQAEKASNMLKRLEELEAEEDLIRQRWATITYEDPVLTRPAIIHKRKKDKSPAVKPSSLPLLSSQSRSDIECYKDRYSHYLDCTGVSTQGKFDPWKVAEGMADELLGGLLEGVADEVEQLCDNTVEGLYHSEFIRPP